MYITGLAICWIIAVLIVTADPKTESNRWFSAAAFVYGFFWIGLLVHQQFPPEPTIHSKAAEIWEGFFYSITHYFLPYCTLMYALCYTKILARWKKYLAMVLLIPVALMYIFFPVKTLSNPGSDSFSVTIFTLLLWMAPYMLGGIVLLLVSYFRAKNHWERLDRMIMCLSVIPSAVKVVSIEFLLGFNRLNFNNAAQINILCGVFEFITILLGTISFGIFGVKLQVEKNRLSGAIQSMTFGTAFLNHILKNEILKVAMCIENIKPYLQREPSLVNDSISMIANSTQRMLSMIERIQKQVGEFKIKIARINIIPLIEDVLYHLKPLLEAKNIKVLKNYGDEVVIPCDGFHMREVFGNLFKNAIEAMNPGGELAIDVNIIHKRIVIAIKDNGTGIDKEDLPRVMEPFFTTKERKNNFGLGLPYCYNVMQRHAGTLEIVSKKGEGTTVFLNFVIKNLRIRARCAP